jgi:stage II sporulation protein M
MSDESIKKIKNLVSPKKEKTNSIYQAKLGFYLILSCLMFLLFIVTGYWTSHADPQVGDMVYTMFQETVAAEVISDSAPIMAFQIFTNNLQICMLAFLGGATFGFLTIFLLMTNGILIGILIEVMLREKSIPALLVGLLPHGIFEIPAILVSTALGMIMARGLWEELAGNGNTLDTAKAAGRLFLLYVVPLILIAACIEGFITPIAMEMLL